ncbi:hypothetical protein Q9966_016679 [Columba livia]|nr:hypothetical protein Q9966_016679 [Columba livia]
MMFRDQVGIVAGWFKGWNECEQTVALLSLLKRVTRTQARFLQLCLEHSLADCPDIHLLEAEANSAAAISQWPQEPAEALVALLLAHLPLLQPGERGGQGRVHEAAAEGAGGRHRAQPLRGGEPAAAVLRAHSTRPPRWTTAAPWRSGWATWRSVWLAEPPAARRRGRRHGPAPSPRPAGGWRTTSGPSRAGPRGGAAPAPPRENGHPSFQQPPGNGGDMGGAALPCQLHPPSPIKRSLALVPGGAGVAGGGAAPARTPPAPPPPISGSPCPPRAARAPSSPTRGGAGGRNTFQEDGSGMKDVPSWLKSLRLHKYAALFSQMTYEEMMTLTERHLESQNVTKGARHKIALSIQKLRERQSVLRALEKDILEGGERVVGAAGAAADPGHPHQGLSAPPRPRPPPAPRTGPPRGPPMPSPPPPHPAGDTEAPAAPVPDGDIPGQFTRVMGKVCTQLLVSRAGTRRTSPVTSSSSRSA